MNKVDLNFVTDGTLDRIFAHRRSRADDLREWLKFDLERIQDYAERVTEHSRELCKLGVDCTEELKAASEYLSGVALLAQVLWREHGGRE